MTNYDAFFAIGCVLFLGLLIYGPWQSVCTDFARQIIFEKREKLFNLAFEGKLDFDSREYRIIRESLESQIRFAHELTLPRLYVVKYALKRKAGMPNTTDTANAIERIQDPTVRQEVKQIADASNRALVAMMVFKSPFAVLFLLAVILPAYYWFGFSPRINRERVRAGKLIQFEAENLPSKA